MPTPSPIIDTRIGVIVLMSVRPARMNSSRNAVASATIASAIGMNIATKRAEDDQQHDDRRQQAEQLGGALLDRRELGLAVELDRDADRLARPRRKKSSHRHDLSRSVSSIVWSNCASA